MNQTIQARDLQPHTDTVEGDFIVGLDNGYVVEVDFDTDYISLGRLSGRLPDDMVLITYHDQDGEENYLILREEHPVTVERK